MADKNDLCSDHYIEYKTLVQFISDESSKNDHVFYTFFYNV